MNTIRELKQQEKYKTMLKRKNKEKKIYKDRKFNRKRGIKMTKEELEKKYLIMKENAETLANRIDKAIEYIKENKIEGIDDDGYSDAWFDYVYVRDLLKILKGEDKE